MPPHPQELLGFVNSHRAFVDLTLRGYPYTFKDFGDFNPSMWEMIQEFKELNGCLKQKLNKEALFRAYPSNSRRF